MQITCGIELSISGGRNWQGNLPTSKFKWNSMKKSSQREKGKFQKAMTKEVRYKRGNNGKRRARFHMEKQETFDKGGCNFLLET